MSRGQDRILARLLGCFVSMTRREQDVLYAIVESYIHTGEPVASRTISRHGKDNLSAATIRNVMADLVDEGYLSQPHTSAGRVPTEKAFRFYASSMTAKRIANADSDRLCNEFSSLDTVGARVERSSYVLMELTRNVGIAAAIPALAQELDQIELVPLAGNRLLMILVTRARMVRHRVVALEEPASAEELASIR